MKFAIIGDSHSMYFVQYNKINHISKNPWNIKDYKVADISSATIRGLGKEKSTLNLRERVESLISENKLKHVVFALGQVDTEIGYYYRSIVKGENPDNFILENFIKETIDTYRNYLLILKEKYNINIIIKGINPTVLISDDFAANYISHITTINVNQDERDALKEKVRSQLSDYRFRFELNQNLNTALKKMALEIDAVYFDIWDKVLDSETGMIDIKYLPAFHDHHLADCAEIRQIHYEALYEVMKEFA